MWTWHPHLPARKARSEHGESSPATPEPRVARHVWHGVGLTESGRASMGRGQDRVEGGDYGEQIFSIKLKIL